MFKKVSCMFICLIFLLSVSCVVAEENINEYSSLPDDMDVMVEYNGIIDIEINDDELYADSYDESDTSDVDQSVELNTTGVVMSDDSYSCGAASFATVVNNLGMNISLDEAKTAVNTTTDGTTVEGIINGAKYYNLTAYGVSVNVDYLNENYIVHLSINGTEHWSVVKEISQNHVILADSSMGNINFTKEEFCNFYTNNSIVISKSLSDLTILNSNNAVIISDYKKLKISGKAKWITKKSKKKQWRVYKYKVQWRWVYKYDYCAPMRMGSSYVYITQYSKVYNYGKWNSLW